MQRESHLVLQEIDYKKANATALLHDSVNRFLLTF